MTLTTEPGTAASAHRTARTWPDTIATACALLVGVGLTVAVQWPAVASELEFVVVNVAVVLSMVGLGCYLSRVDERFSGICFMVAGAGWIVTGLDVHPRWGSAPSWLFGGALVYTSIGWGILRYGRPYLARRERLFVVCCVAATTGMCTLLMLFSRPEWLAYSPEALWLTVWPNPTTTAVLNLVACVGYLGLGCLFASVAFRRLTETSPVQRRIQRPLVLAGAGWAAAASVVTTVGSLSPETVPIHTNSTIVGALSVVVTGALAVAIHRNRMLGASFLDVLPTQRTPEALDAYVRGALADPTAQLLFVVPERDVLIDSRGRQRGLPESGAGCHRWIVGSAGRPVGVLVGGASVGDDGTWRAFGKILSILAENEQLHAVLRMRLVQLAAVREAERFAFDRAREQFRRDLHDGVQQTIAAARIDLDGVRDVLVERGIPAETDGLDRKLTTALDQIRCLKAGADPPEMTVGLKSALERTIAELRLNARCDVHADGLGILALPLYYVAREALTNAHKHARHATVEIVLRRQPGDLIELVVRDAGPGGATARPGGGLDGLRRRVVDLGGEFALTSPPGRGTTLVVTVPAVDQ